MIFTQNRKHKTTRLEEIEEYLSKEFYCLSYHNPYDAYMEIYTLDKPDRFLWFKRRRFLGNLCINTRELDSIIYLCTTSVEFGNQIHKILVAKWKNLIVSIQDEHLVRSLGFVKLSDEAYEEFKQKKEKNENQQPATTN